MLSILRVGLSLVILLSAAGCSGLAKPVAVLQPSPANLGKEPTQIGIACAYKILWVFSFGDAHIRTAKEKGRISEIATVETVDKILLVDAFPFNFYKRYCTEVSGFSS